MHKEFRRSQLNGQLNDQMMSLAALLVTKVIFRALAPLVL